MWSQTYLQNPEAVESVPVVDGLSTDWRAVSTLPVHHAYFITYNKHKTVSTLPVHHAYFITCNKHKTISTTTRTSSPTTHMRLSVPYQYSTGTSLPTTNTRLSVSCRYTTPAVSTPRVLSPRSNKNTFRGTQITFRK